MVSEHHNIAFRLSRIRARCERPTDVRRQGIELRMRHRLQAYFSPDGKAHDPRQHGLATPGSLLTGFGYAHPFVPFSLLATSGHGHAKLAAES